METKTYEEVLSETGTLCWRTVGVSMRPLIREGKDVIVLRKLISQPKKYDVVLFRRPGVTGRGAYVLHRILRVNDDGTFWIVGDNCWSGETVREEDILGILSEMVRGGKKIKMDSFLYKAYVHLWCDLWPVRFIIVKYKTYPGRATRKLLRIITKHPAK